MLPVWLLYYDDKNVVFDEVDFLCQLFFMHPSTIMQALWEIGVNITHCTIIALI